VRQKLRYEVGVGYISVQIGLITGNFYLKLHECCKEYLRNALMRYNFLLQKFVRPIPCLDYEKVDNIS